ncbi:hypothetical protein NDU88_007589, partial [Pleurodeles waltl]
ISTWHSHSMWWRGFLQQSGHYMTQSLTGVEGRTLKESCSSQVSTWHSHSLGWRVGPC